MKKGISLGIISIFVMALFVGALPMVTADGAVSWSNPDMGYGGSAVSWNNPNMGYGGSAVSWMNSVEILCAVYGREYYTAFNFFENRMYGSPDLILDEPIYDSDGNEIICDPPVLSKHKQFVNVGITDKIVYGRIDFYWKSSKVGVEDGVTYDEYIYCGCGYFAYIVESPYRGIYIPVSA